LHPTFASLPNFIPPLFCLYLLVLPILLCVFPVSKWLLPAVLPIVLYILAVLVQTICIAGRSKVSLAARALPLVVLTNILYGLGFWRGLFIRIVPPPSALDRDIRFETVPV
jgi:hypothetical protein